MATAFERSLIDPATPRYPALLEEASYVRLQETAVIHSICSILFRRETPANGYSLSIYPSGTHHVGYRWDFTKPSFTVGVYEPEGASILGCTSNTDFEAVLPKAVIPRPDNPHKWRLTASGQERILLALRHGTYHDYFGSHQYGGPLGIDTILNRRRRQK